MRQPGACVRSDKVTFRCPGCAAEGHDHKQEHAVLFEDGRFTCVVEKAHRSAIAEALGVKSALSGVQSPLRGVQSNLRSIS